MKHELIILGSAQDGGLPQFGARGEPDRKARLDPLAVRLGPSVCVLSVDGKALLVDASPDIKTQEQRLLKVGRYASRPPDAPPFDTIVLTHAHVGHYAGLVHFGREAAATSRVPCHASAAMTRFLRENNPWAHLVELGHIEPVETAPGTPFSPWPGLEIELIPVPHRGEFSDTVAVSLNGRVLYLPDIDDWAAWPDAEKVITSHETCLLDATFYDRDELPGRDISEIPHPLVVDTIDRWAGMCGERRMILTHLNHSNPLCDPASPQAATVRAAGFEIAQEMMSISF